MWARYCICTFNSIQTLYIYIHANGLLPSFRINPLSRCKSSGKGDPSSWDQLHTPVNGGNSRANGLRVELLFGMGEGPSSELRNQNIGASWGVKNTCIVYIFLKIRLIAYMYIYILIYIYIFLFKYILYIHIYVYIYIFTSWFWTTRFDASCYQKWLMCPPIAT